MIKKVRVGTFRGQMRRCGTLSAIAARAVGLGVPAARAQTAPPPAAGATRLAGFRQVEVASVSDAEETLLGQRLYLRHDMRPLFPVKFVGFALTVELEPAPGAPGATALAGMLTALDHGAADSVWVMVVDKGPDFPGMGGEMGTTMAARGFTGAVIDGGVRGTAYLQQLRFPVFSLSIVPSTTAGHYAFASANQPVVCDGVKVAPGDIADVERVLALARKLDYTEHVTDAIARDKKIEQAAKASGRM